MAWERRGQRLVGGTALLGALLLLATARDPAILHQLGQQGTGSTDGDSALMTWWLAWTAHAVSAGHSPLVTGALAGPNGVNGLQNASLLLPGVLLTPLTRLAGARTSFDLLVWSAPALTSFSSFWWLRRHARALPAVVGAVVIGFNPFVTIGLSVDVFVTLLVFVPVILIMFERLLTGAPHRVLAGVVLGLAVVAQILTGSEVLVILGIASVAAAVTLAAQRPSEILPAIRTSLPGLTVAAVVAGALLAYPLSVLFRPEWRTAGPVQYQDVYETRLPDFVRPSTQLLVSPSGSHVYFQERGAYLGLLVVALLVAVLLLRRSIVARTAAVVAVVAVVLSFGGYYHRVPLTRTHDGLRLPWLLFENTVPYLDNLLPVRFVLVLWFCAGILVAMSLDRLPGLPRVPATAYAGIVVLALIGLVPGRTTPSPGHYPVPAFFSAGLPGFPIHALLLVGPGAFPTDTRAMAWQEAAGFRFSMVTGYSARPDPRTRKPTFTSGGAADILTPLPHPTLGLSPAQAAAARQELGRQGVYAVVVGPNPEEARELRVSRELTGRDADRHEGGVSIWFLGAAPSGPTS